LKQEEKPMAGNGNITTELDIVKQMAELMKALDEDGKRRALWYLADLAGLSQRAGAAPQGSMQAGQMPMGQQARRMPAGAGAPPELNAAMFAAAKRAKDQADKNAGTDS
jgi:hypothetical protein